MDKRRSQRRWRGFLACLYGCFVLGVSAGGGLQCSCPGEGDEPPPASSEEPVTPEPDGGDSGEERFQCPEISGRSCQVHEECLAPKPPPPKLPICPPGYCSSPTTRHSRTQTTDPFKPGSSKWNRAFYPERKECECRLSCASLECISGTCQLPIPRTEPVPEPPPLPDLPPACPNVCDTDADCTPQLCQEKTACSKETKRCINPLIRP